MSFELPHGRVMPEKIAVGLLGQIAAWRIAGFGTVLLVCVSGCSRGPSDSTGVQWTGEAYLPEGAVLPTEEPIETGAYAPLSRPLLLYVRNEALKRPELAEFLRYYLSDEGQQLVADTGYVRLDAGQLAESRQALEAAITASGSAGTSSGELQGEVTIDGSSTVFLISQAVAEEFSLLHRKVRTSVSESGTGGGFERFLVKGGTDINDASRPISAKEIEKAQEAGVAYTELKIAIDGLTVVVHPQNHWVDGMTVAELRKIWEPNSPVQKWSDVREGWPDVDIELFGPGTDSGTFDYFTEVVVGEAKKSRPDYEPSEDDNTLVRGVAGNVASLGYFGYAYYAENQDQVKALAIAATE